MSRVAHRICRACHRTMPPASTLVVDPQINKVMSDGKCQTLGNREYLVLRTLAENAGNLCERKTLESAASMQTADPRALNVVMSRIRSRIGRTRIECVEKQGYRIVGAVRVQAIA